MDRFFLYLAAMLMSLIGLAVTVFTWAVAAAVVWVVWHYLGSL